MRKPILNIRSRWDVARMHNRKNFGVAEIVGVIIVLGIIGSSITMVLGWYNPYIEAEKADANVKSALTQFCTMNDVIQDVVTQGANCTSFFNFAAADGQVTIDSQGGVRLIIYYSLDPDYDFNISGLEDSDNSFDICQKKGWMRPDVFVDYLDGTPPEFLDWGMSLTSSTDCNCPPPPCYDFYTPSNSISPLTGSIKININSSNSGPSGYHLVGQLYLIDTGSIKYQLSSNSGIQTVTCENGAVIQTYQSGDSWMKETPVVFDQDSHFVLNIIQINGSVNVGGAGNYKFNLKVENRQIRENNQPAYNFKIKIFGEHNETWYEYFRSKYDFENFASIWLPNTVGPDASPIEFTLAHSVCDTSLVQMTRNYPPYTPSNPNPPNGDTGAGVNADLIWTGGDPDGDPVTYEIYLGTSNPPSYVTTVTEETYNPGELSSSASYWWQIIAIDDNGFITEGAIWHFSTGADASEL